MPKHTISFAKLFSPPSSTAWAQTYHAGNVYTVVSATQIEAPVGNPEHAIPSVHVLGKDIINNLEAEYFAIATKTLETMKEAVINACKEIPDNVAATVIFGVVQENILYLFLYGKGHVYMKRGEKFGSLLEIPQEMIDKKQVIAISGPIQPGDVIVLATDEIVQAIPKETFANELQQSPSEAADALSSGIDDEKFAGAAAIIFAVDPIQTEKSQIYSEKTALVMPAAHTKQTNPHAEKPNEEEKTQNQTEQPTPVMRTVEETEPNEKTLEDAIKKDEEEKMDLDAKPTFVFEKDLQETKEEQPEPIEKQPSEKKKRKLPKPSIRQAFFLLVAITLAGVLGTSIFVTQKKQQTTQAQTLFKSQFPSAKQKYDEGQSLLSLNKNLAMDDFSKAKTILESLKKSVPASSSDASQITDLLDKVNQALGPVSDTQKTSLKQANTSASKLLAAEIANPNIAYFAQDGSIYAADTNDISSIDSANKLKSLIKNAGDWTDIGGFGTYLGNFYLLDKKAEQILKFTKASDGFGKSNYFSNSNASLSQATSIGIDGSVWILFTDGSIKKFTKGQPDQFTIGKLDKPLANPTRIFTNVDIDNVYILDNGNSRIVVLKKSDGSLINQYDAPELKTAKDIDVDEKSKKIYILTGDKVSELDM